MEVDASHSALATIAEPPRTPSPPVTPLSPSTTVDNQHTFPQSQPLYTASPGIIPARPVVLDNSPRVKCRREDAELSCSLQNYEYNNQYAFQHSLDCNLCRSFRRHLDHDMACFPHRFHDAWSSSDAYLGGLQDTAHTAGRLAGFQDAQRKFDSILQISEDHYSCQLASLDQELAAVRAQLGDARLVPFPHQGAPEFPPHLNSQGLVPREPHSLFHTTMNPRGFRDDAFSPRDAFHVAVTAPPTHRRGPTNPNDLYEQVDGQPLDSDGMRRVRSGHATLSRAPFPAIRCTLQSPTDPHGLHMDST
ncbi:hypothetical protein BD410DRAFT_846261 [Rickenella mellea]|uniref:Uncharacterized protein n=1 Tax=Rickenella mellea TaxID=50990 RepID=A0A4Y7PI27_9AGAM|nr:hypothetical protein BD410DRAFT_846261 [Rickenella mellea]